MAILDDPARIWHEALDTPQGQEPAALILEGTWWRADATRNRLAHLENVVELQLPDMFPDVFIGTHNGARIACCCAYGAARAAEPAHIRARTGTPLLIRIGTCGTLDVNAVTGMVVLPGVVAARDGISRRYGAGPQVHASARWIDAAEPLLIAQNVQTRRVHHLTWPSLFAPSQAMRGAWTAEGAHSIDMETSAVIVLAGYIGAQAVSLLSVRDAPPHGRSFMDPLPATDAACLERSHEIVFTAALDLAHQAAEHRQAA